MAKRQPKPKPPPDTLQDDVQQACLRIYAQAKALGWDLGHLSDIAGPPFQSFVNWKQGHQLPKIEKLQKFARAVGRNLRVVLDDDPTLHHTRGLAMASRWAKSIALMVDRLSSEEQKQELWEKVSDYVEAHVSGSRPPPAAPEKRSGTEAAK